MSICLTVDYARSTDTMSQLKTKIERVQAESREHENSANDLELELDLLLSKLQKRETELLAEVSSHAKVLFLITPQITWTNYYLTHWCCRQ